MKRRRQASHLLYTAIIVRDVAALRWLCNEACPSPRFWIRWHS